MENVNRYIPYPIFRPKSTQTSEFQVALEALSCVLNGHKCVYVALPVTGGPRFINWYNQSGNNYEKNTPEYWSQLRKYVIGPNTVDASNHIKKLRNNSISQFIDPSQLYIESWTQDDYRHFWSLVIEQFAEKAIFLDGWHLSSGCIYEFFVTKSLGIYVRDQSLNEISIGDGLSLVNEGRSALKSIGADTEFIDIVISKLSDLSQSINLGAKNA